jgi:hypothetical protein
VRSAAEVVLVLGPPEHDHRPEPDANEAREPGQRRRAHQRVVAGLVGPARLDELPPAQPGSIDRERAVDGGGVDHRFAPA